MRQGSVAVQRRLLFLLPFPPRLDGIHGGSRAIAQLLLHLAPRHSIALLYMRAADESCLDETIKAACVLTEAVQRPLRTRSAITRTLHPARIWSNLLLNRPSWVTDWNVPEFAARLKKVVASWRPDIIHMEYQIMAQYASILRDYPAPRILTIHEPATQALIEKLEYGQTTGRWFPVFEKRAWQHYERKIMDTVQSVIVFTDSDRQVLEHLNQRAAICCIPLGTPLPLLPLDPCGSDPPGIVFVGNFVHPPNLDAALRLAHSIMPRLWTRFPNVHLTIVGDRPPASLRYQLDTRVRVTGRVPDVTPYLDEATVVVIPLRYGGGMRVKVLEALAAGKAIVASPRSARGLDLIDGEHILLAEQDQEFVDAISILLSDKTRRAAIAAQAREMAVNHLGWSASVKSYEALYAKLCAGSSGKELA